MYVGVPRTTLTWDVQKDQLRYNAWEDYNPDANPVGHDSTRYDAEVASAVGVSS